MLRLALAGRPGLALSGLAALLRGKRVRGWNRICAAAADHPAAYHAWIRSVEPLAVRPPAPFPGRIGAVVLAAGDDPAAAERTRCSLRQAFGDQLHFLADDTTPADLPDDAPDWILPIPAGDCVAETLSAALGGALQPGPGLMYWDEDRATGYRQDPWFKPAWDPVLFGRCDGLVGASLIARSAISNPGPGDGWWDCALQAGASAGACRVAGVLTHRAGVVKQRPPSATALPACSLSVIIPTRDRADLLARCLDGVGRTSWPGPREIIVIDNGSVEPATARLLGRLQAEGAVRVIPQPGPFNYAALMNAGVAAASGELVCLLNNDVEPLGDGWLGAMARHAVEDDVGAVGARLLYPDGRIQHAGVALGIGDAAGHVEKGIHDVAGFAPWHAFDRTVSAVTAACMLLAREKFLAVGGMDAERFAVDFNDVDLCLRLGKRGWHTIYCADARLVHGESLSRGSTRSAAEQVRFERELAALRERWQTDRIEDPWWHPAFRRQSERVVLRL